MHHILKIYSENEVENRNYGNVDFVKGSVAEVERLWSVADRYVDGSRNSTSPLLMEAMIFLKFNKDFWDEKTIVDAYKIACDDDLSNRIQELVLEDDFFHDSQSIYY